AKTNERKELSSSALEYLWHYHWPGNVRELFNNLERAVVLTSDRVITEKDFPAIIPEQDSSVGRSVHITPLKELEKSQIKLALEVEGGNKTRAAAALGVSRRQLYRLMHKHKIF
ncbi:MAG: sigma-54-dependent Fis family transcriptional regulator, partial [Calditrichaeota bacterium]